MKRLTQKLARILLAGLLALSPILSILIPALIGVVAPVFVFFSQTPQEVQAAPRELYWVGGTGIWDATAGAKWSLADGGASGEAIPDSDDNVHFTLASGVVTVSIAATGACVCNDLDTTGFAGSFGGNGLTDVYGSLTLGAANLTQYTGAITFKATGAGETITTNGKQFNGASFTGAGGVWTLQDAVSFSNNGSFDHTKGTVDTNNKSVTGYAFLSSGNTARTLITGTSTITCVSFFSISGSNLTSDFSSNTINVSLADSFSGGNLSYGTVSLTAGTATTIPITGANTYVNLSLLGTNLANEDFTFDSNQVISGTFTATGYNAITRRLLIASSVLGTSRQITAAARSITNCNLRDIAAGNPIWNISAGLNSDYGGNYGITFTALQNNYWVGNSGSWSEASHWSSTSGGTGGTGRVPLVGDMAIFDANSITILARTITMDVLDVCTINTVNVANTPTFSGTPIYVYGSLNLGIATWSVTNTYMYSPSPSSIISVSSLINLYISTTTGVVKLAGDVICTGTVYLTSGYLDLDGYDLTASIFDSSGASTRGLLLGEGSFILNGIGTKWNVAAGGLTLTRETGTIHLTSAVANDCTFAGAGLTYNNLIVEGAGNYALTISGANTFVDFTIDRSVAAKTVKFTNGITQTVNNLYIPIVSTTVVTLKSTTDTATWTITKAGGAVFSDYLSLRDSTAAGTATYYAGSHSTNVANNFGWLWTDPTTPIVSTSSPSNLASNLVTLNGRLDTIDGVSIGYAYFEWGLTTGYLNGATADQTLSSAGNFGQDISGLTAATTYHYRSVFRYSGSTKVYGGDVSFTTTTAPPGAPTIVTGVATSVQKTTATLQGLLTSLGIYSPVYVYFEYGTTIAYGMPTTELTKLLVTSYSADITGLTAGTTYHFRAVARYGTSSKVYGADNTFTYANMSIESANVFRGYLETGTVALPKGDLLITVEYINNLSPYAPEKDPTMFFAMQLLSVDGTTILASTPLPHWGDKPTSIYLSAASSTGITDGAAYIIRMIGLYASPASTTYQLVPSDWRGTSMTSLDTWVRDAAWSMNTDYNLTGDYVLITNMPGRDGEVLSEAGEPYFTKGIPYLKSKRPLLFATGSLGTDSLFGGTPNLTFDTSKTWQVEVGSRIATDMTNLGNLFGLTGRNFNGFLILGGIIAVGGLLLSNGVVAVAGLFIAGLVLEVGTQFRAIDIQYLLVPTIILLVIFVASYFWDRG